MLVGLAGGGRTKNAEDLLEGNCQLIFWVLLRTLGRYVVALKTLVCRLAIVVVVGFSDERVMRR